MMDNGLTCLLIEIVVTGSFATERLAAQILAIERLPQTDDETESVCSKMKVVLSV